MRPHYSLVLSGCFLALSSLSAAPDRDSAAVPKGLKPSDWTSIRAAYDAGRHAFVQQKDGSHSARNPGQQWRTRIDGRGFNTQPDAGGWQWGLELRRYGKPGSEQTISRSPSVEAKEQRVTYVWDDTVQEWFVNDLRGLEHGFTVMKRPLGTASAPVLFELAVRGTLVPRVSADGQGVQFLDNQGSTVLHYAGLKVWDADGKVLPAHFEPVNAHDSSLLRLLVEERGARYPITVDPIAQQAYIKASNAGYGDNFGQEVAMSGDTVVVSAWAEDSNATGIDGDQSDNSSETAGAAYVFVRNGASWSQQAYLKASNTDVHDFFGDSVAVSGDTIVVGASGEDSSAVGVNNNGNDNSADYSGAAYVFVRSGTAWTQQAYLKASNTGAADAFGSAVAVSGDIIVVGASSEASNATGINGDQNDNSATEAGAAYVFVRSSGLWSQQAYLKASNNEALDEFGWSVAVSGETVLVGAKREFSDATGVNGDQNNNNANQAGAAYVFVRSGTEWSQQAYLKASNTGAYDYFGQSVALSGNTAVIGAPFERGSGTGVNPPSNELALGAGAAYVFMRSGTSWSQQAYLKASNTNEYDQFGGSVAISGDIVVVGAVEEDSNATGINGSQNDNSANQAGAAYVFLRTGFEWDQQAYLKASNTETTDQFGASVAVFGDTAIIGAPQEASSATTINGEQNDNSSTSAGAVYAFAGLGAPVIAVEQPVDHNLANGERIDFGNVGVKKPDLRTFTIRNLGSLPLTDVAVTLTGLHAAQFTLTEDPDATVAPGDSTTFTVQAKVTSTGAKSAMLNIASNDPNYPVAFFPLAATGITLPLPAAITAAATGIDFDPMGMGVNIARATLNGTVNARGHLRDVFFDYGPTTAYGTTVNATPATLSSNIVESVSTGLTGLLPHKLYHYRVRAAAEYGSANGADKNFTTPNHQANAAPDDMILVLPGASVAIDVLDNDSDADGDPLRITAKTVVTPSSAGTLAIVANQLVFTASASFTHADFGYTMTDGFGPSATSTVSVDVGTCTLSPPTKAVPSAGITYPLMITANGTWAVSEGLSWASVSPTRGTGDTLVQVTLLPNAARTERKGDIKIGDKLHSITQAGVLRPVLDPLVTTDYDAIVSGDFSLPIPTQNAPVTYTTTHLPPGLRLSNTTGTLSGKPTVPGVYHMTVRATNAMGTSVDTLSFTITVVALPTGTVGTFHGFIKRSADIHITAFPDLGARFEMTTTSTGAVSGKMIEGVTPKAFTGQLDATVADAYHPTLTAAIPGTAFTLDVILNHSGDALTGTLHDTGPVHSADVSAWRKPWLTIAPIQKASDFKALHTFGIENTDSSGPQGFGYGSFTVTENTGALTITGKLADGSALLCSTFIGQGGQVLLYQSLYGHRGSCLGALTVTPGTPAPLNNSLVGTLSWLKPTPLAGSTDTVYRAGFGPLALTAVGSTYIAPDKGQRVMALPLVISPATNAELAFTLGGLDAEMIQFTQAARIANPSTIGLTNFAAIALYNASIIPNPNPNRVTLPVLTASNGLFSGSFTIAGATTALNRKAPCFGQIVRTGTGTQGYGYFLLPQAHGFGQTVSTSPKLSGRMILKKAP